ncbi:MAG: glycoside hydrolase family 3 N-terminal domain-containing protein [Verrucomicrobiales bacterium]
MRIRDFTIGIVVAALLPGRAGATPSAVPAIIQAEAYEEGGDGIGYHDATPGNLGGAFRDDGVDIFRGGAEGHYVGDTSPGEWLEFMISVETGFNCQLRYRVAAESASAVFNLRLEIDGITKDVVVTGAAGGATTWSDVFSSRTFRLAAGDHRVRISFLNLGLNIDEIEFATSSEPAPAYLDPSRPVAERVEDLIGRMTTNEKIGQTCLVGSDFLVGTHRGDPVHQESDIRDWMLGGLFSGGGSAPSPNTVESWADTIDRFQAYALSTRLGIPVIYGSDAVHGHNNMRDATLFPHNVGLGASGDAALVERIARATALECAAAGVRWSFAPTVSIARDVRWGRVYESFGEIPSVATPLAAATVRGLHGEDLSRPGAVLACAKHFVGDGGASWGTGPFDTIDRGDAVIDEATLRQLHLPPFEAAISEGCLSIMAALSTWNGAQLHGHRYMLTDVLKGELGFRGFVLSDWRGIDALDYGSYRGAITAAVNAGLDLNMIPDRYVEYSQQYRIAASTAAIPMARLDDAVRRILTVKFELGLFERPFSARELIPVVRSREHLQLAREAVAKSIVLLKNDATLLPLSKDMARIHVAGRHARDVGLQCGGWTISWQGSAGATTAGTTILEAITASVSAATEVSHSDDGGGAAGADVCLVVIGEEPYAEFRGDSAGLRPSATDLATLARARVSGVPLILMVISGRPLILDPEIDDCQACLALWLPGTEGQGVADVLFADQFVRGITPQSWPRSDSALPINVGDAVYEPLFPFGAGISLQPSLAIEALDGRMILTWPAAAGGFALEESTSLGTATWSLVDMTPVRVGDELMLEMPTSGDRMFFKLSLP